MLSPMLRSLEHADEYPHEMVEKMKEMGLFGAVVPKEYGGLGLDNVTFALDHRRALQGVDEPERDHRQPFDHDLCHRQLWDGGAEAEVSCPRLSRVRSGGGIGLTEPGGGSDLQSIQDDGG